MKFKFLNTIISGLLLSVCCLINTANAGLIVDNGTYTTDTVTGFDWLDASYTDGLSYNQVLNEISSGSLIGWQVASMDEVLDLLLHANNNVVFPYTEGQGLTSSAYSNITNLIDFIGPSYSGSTYVDLIAYTSDLNSIYNNQPTWHQTLQLHKWTNGNHFLRVNSWSSESSQANTSIATWLRRGDSVNVPEPSTLAIFALGMIGLASRRFKK
jgi:hypothetical protein